MRIDSLTDGQEEGRRDEKEGGESRTDESREHAEMKGINARKQKEGPGRLGLETQKLITFSINT